MRLVYVRLLLAFTFLLFSCAPKKERLSVSFVDKAKLKKVEKPREKTIIKEEKPRPKETEIIYKAHRERLEKKKEERGVCLTNTMNMIYT